MNGNVMPDISSIFPGWQVVDIVGEGSFGKVYKCIKNELGIEITGALKVISIPQNKSEIDTVRLEGMGPDAVKSYFGEMVNDFTNEIKVMLTLKGAPNIVTVENYKIVEHKDEIGWDIYIFMEFLTTFTNYSSSRKMTEKEVKHFGIDICNGLEVCAKKNIIHRDIKPDNLFVDEYGNYKLGDFGVARRLEGTVSAMSKKGTYSYMAPEVFFGKKYDNRADIYSLGMVMYKLLNRKREPFIDVNKDFVSYQDRTAAIERRRSGEKLPPPVDASPEMASIILKACAFDPNERFAGAAQFKEALENLGTVQTSPVRPVQAPPVRPVQAPPARPVQTPPARPVQAPPVRPVQAPPARPVQAPPARPVQAPHARPVQTPPARPVQVSAPKKKTNKLIILIPIILVLTAIILAVVFLSDSSDNSSFGGPDRKNKGNVTSSQNSGQSGTSDDIVLDFSGHGNKNVAVGNTYVVAIKADGTLITAGSDDHDQLKVSGWKDIVAVSAGDDQTIGLKSDGTVLATGYNDYGECNVSGWKNIVAIASGDDYHTIGLKSDGTVVATGLNTNGQCNVSSWKNIVAVDGGTNHTVGLRSDGTVVATGLNDKGQCNVGSWTNIVSISAAGNQTFGVKSDGTVLVAGANEYGETGVLSWRDIGYVVSDYDHTIGVKKDGNLIFTGLDNKGEGNVSGWCAVNSIETDEFCTAFIDNSGHLYVFGSNTYGQMSISGTGGMKTD